MIGQLDPNRREYSIREVASITGRTLEQVGEGVLTRAISIREAGSMLMIPKAEVERLLREGVPDGGS